MLAESVGEAWVTAAFTFVWLILRIFPLSSFKMAVLYLGAYISTRYVRKVTRLIRENSFN